MIDFRINRRRPRIELAPMIDVVFFILFFFLMFSTLKTAQTGVPVNIPKTTHLGRPENNTVVVTINKYYQVFYGTEAVDLTDLNRKVAAELNRDAETRIIVKPDATVPYQEIIRVMDTLAAAGVQQPLLGVDRRQIPEGTPRP